jgi:Nuclease-related domain
MMPLSMARTTSPLKGPLLRQPGQSLDEELQRLDALEANPMAATIVLTALLAIIEWVRWVWPFAPQPLLVSAFALAILFAGIRKGRLLRSVRARLRLGRDGERQVAQILDLLREDGFLFIHDLPADGFNLDHIVIGPTGVFVVETKTRNRSVHRSGTEAHITIQGDVLWCEGQPMQGDAIQQAKAEARWLETLLNRLLDESIPVQPAVTFPGWFVSCDRPYDQAVWVCNPKGLVTFVKNRRFALASRLQERIYRALVEYVHMRQQVLDAVTAEKLA